MRLRWPVRARDRRTDLGARRPSRDHLQRRQINSAADGESCARSTRSSWGVPLLATSSAPRPGRRTRSGPFGYASLACRVTGGAHGIRTLRRFSPAYERLTRLRAGRAHVTLASRHLAIHSRDRFRRGRSRRLGPVSEQMSVKGGGVERSAIRDASASGLQSRLRSAAAGMKPSAAILPWAFQLLFQVSRSHIRVRTRATVRTIAPSPASATASAAAIRSWVSPAILPALREDLHRRLTPTRLFALRPLRPTSYTASRIAAIAGPFSVFEGLMPGRPATRRDCNRPTVRGRLPV